MAGAETWCLANSAVNIHSFPAAAANQVMVVVADPGFVKCWRTCRLDSADQTFLHHHTQCVIDGLSGNDPNLCANFLRNAIRRVVRAPRYGTNHGEALGRHWYSKISKKVCWISHSFELKQDLDRVQTNCIARLRYSKINPLHPLGYTGQNIPGDGPSFGGDLCGSNHLTALFSDQNRFISGLNLGQVTHIHHDLIHRDSP